jgi:hypothetical protein
MDTPTRGGIFVPKWLWQRRAKTRPVPRRGQQDEHHPNQISGWMLSQDAHDPKLHLEVLDVLLAALDTNI